MHESRRGSHATASCAFATLAWILAMGSMAHARMQRTPSLTSPPDGYLYCKVVATSSKPIRIIAAVLSDAGVDVTEFGYGSRVKTDDGFDAEETAGSFNHETARYYCRVVTTRVLRRNVQVSLAAFDKDGVCVATVDMR